MCDIKKVYRFKKYHVSVIMNICAATENSKLKIYIKKHFNIFKKQNRYGSLPIYRVLLLDNNI